MNLLRFENLQKKLPFRILKRGLLGLMVIELAYVLGANTLLASGAIQKFVNDTHAAHLEFGPSYTVIPTRVHVTDVRLRYQDRNMQFACSIEEADVTVDLLWLLKKRFSASRVRANGVSFLFRHKVAQVQGNEQSLASYPPIPGFSDPPLLGVAKISDPKDLWSFALHDVDAKIHELWFMTYRYLGPARATGGFELVPNQSLVVGPAHLSLLSGTLHNGEKVILSHQLKGEVDLQVHRVNPEALTGLATFAPISAAVQLTTRLENLEPVNLYLPDTAQMRVTNGKGNLEVAATLKQGKLAGGSSIGYTMLEPIRVELPQLAAVQAMDLRLTVANTGVTQLSVHARRVDVVSLATPTAKGASLAVAERLQWTTVFNEVDLARANAPTRSRIDVPVLTSSHLERLNPLIRGERSWQLLGGAAVFAASAETDSNGVTRAELTGDFEALQLSLNEHQLWGYGKLAVTYGANKKANSSQIENAELLFRNVTVQSQDRRTSDWWASVSTNHVQLEGPPGRQLGGTIVARAKNADPVLNALDVPGIARAFIPDKPVEVVAKLEQQGDLTRLALLHARTGKLKVRGEMRRESTRTSGVFRVEGIAIPVGIELTDGHSTLTLFASEGWLLEHLRNLGNKPRLTQRSEGPSNQGINGPAQGGLGARSPVAQR